MTLFPFEIWTIENQDEWKTRANVLLLLTFMVNVYLFNGDDTYYDIRHEDFLKGFIFLFSTFGIPVLLQFAHILFVNNLYYYLISFPWDHYFESGDTMFIQIQLLTIPISFVVLQLAKDRWDLEGFKLVLSYPFAFLSAIGLSYCLYWVLNYGIFYAIALLIAPFYYLFFYSWKYFVFGEWSAAVVYLQFYIFLLWAYKT